MAEVFNSIAQFFSGAYDSLSSALGGSLESILLLKMLFFIGLLTLASLFIWKFYNSLSDKDIVSLDLSKYNTSSNPFFGKIAAIVFYLIEYILLAPIVIIIWSAALAIILLMVAKQRSIDEVLIISFALVGTVRILAYSKKEIAADLSKVFPFTLLVVFLLEPGSLNVSQTISQIAQIPLLLGSLVSFLFIVFIIELFLRVLNTIYDFWFSEDQKAEKKIYKK